jgi:glycosyltransferase involved in cell wall biosynthesis
VPRRLCFVVDFRSPHARNWIEAVAAAGDEVHVVSTYAASGSPAIASLTIIPVGFGFAAANPVLRRYVAATGGAGFPPGTTHRPGDDSLGWGLGVTIIRRVALRLRPLGDWVFGPFDVMRQRERLRKAILELKPDLVHAMRLPYEGFLAAEAMRDVPIPLLLSTWGSDLMHFAERYPFVAVLTRRALRRADAMHSDCARDVRLARKWGFSESKIATVLPGGGGIRREVFHQGRESAETYAKWNIPMGRQVVFNPRNFRPNMVRTEESFKAAGILQQEQSDAIFLWAGMEDHPLAVAWRDRLPNPDAVRLLPSLTQREMAELYRIAHVTVSPSVSDGMPNSLLEAMACGSLPVAGELDSVKEWISDGVNGLLCNAREPRSIADAVSRGLRDDALRERAAKHNVELVERRAEANTVMAAASRLYEETIAARTRPVARRAPDIVPAAGLPPRRMRVLYLAHTLARGGSASSLLHLLSHLPKEEIEPIVLAPAGPSRPLFEAAGIPVHTIGSFATLDSIAGAPLKGRRALTVLRAAWALRHSHRLKSVIRELRPDIVHLNDRGLLHAAKVAHELGVPVVMHARSVLDGEVAWYNRLSKSILSRYVDRVIAIDGSVARSLGHVRECEIVYNPLSGHLPAPTLVPQAGGVTRVTFLSGLLRFKGIWDLLQAAELLSDRKDIVIRIAGANPRPRAFYRSAFGRMLRAIGVVEDLERDVASWIARHRLQERVLLMGHLDDANKLLDDTDILVFPSHLNGPGRSVFEAGVRGIPSVVALKDRVEDVVTDGQTGLIVPERNGAALADAIRRMADDSALRVRLGQAARAQYAKQFAPERSAEAVVRVYRDLLKVRRLATPAPKSPERAA